MADIFKCTLLLLFYVNKFLIHNARLVYMASEKDYFKASCLHFICRITYIILLKIGKIRNEFSKIWTFPMSYFLKLVTF